MIEIPNIDWAVLQNGFTALLVVATIAQALADRMAVTRALHEIRQALDDEDETLPENIEGPLEANVVYPEFRPPPAPAPGEAEAGEVLHLLSMMRHALSTGKQHQINRFRPRFEAISWMAVPTTVEECDEMMSWIRANKGKANGR